MTHVDDVPEKVSDTYLLSSIWTSPRLVFTYVNTAKHDKHVGNLIVLAGVAEALDLAGHIGLGDTLSIWTVLIASAIFGGSLGWLSYGLVAVLLSYSGTLLQGKSDIRAMLRVLAYAKVPSIAAMVLLIPQVLVYGNEVFKSEGDIVSAGWTLNSVVYGAMFLEIVLSCWSMVLVVIGISVVQEFSIGRSILNFVLAMLALSVLMGLVL